jgi:prevent-host-death family protein
MLNKITTADARKKFSNILNRVAFGKESFVLTRRGEPIAALVSMDDLKLLRELEDQRDIADGWKAKNEPGEPIPWEDLKRELDL